MSSQTKEALEDALQAHLLDEVGEDTVMTGYAFIVAHKISEDFEAHTTHYYHEYMDHQPFHASIGLVNLHAVQITKQARD